jgi:hypothetical protein
LYRFLAIAVLLDVKDIPQVGPLQWGWIPPFVPVPRLGPTEGGRPDPKWQPKIWQEIVQSQGKKQYEPWLVRICVGPTSADRPDLAALRTFARDQRGFFCVVEERPFLRAAASVEGGAEITATVQGTLGGFLKDQKNNVYGLTCAHVGQQKTANVSIQAWGQTLANAAIVTETSYQSLTALTAQQLCNRNTRNLGSQLDIALLSLDPKHQPQNTVHALGQVDAIYSAAQFGSGDVVEMYGAVSGHNSYAIGAYAVVYKVLFPNGQYYCFDHMFEINPLSGAISNWMPPALTTKAVSGDSGAWVCRANAATGKYAYCGHLVAVGGLNGYACFAEAVLDWAQTQHRLTLACL